MYVKWFPNAGGFKPGQGYVQGGVDLYRGWGWVDKWTHRGWHDARAEHRNKNTKSVTKSTHRCSN